MLVDDSSAEAGKRTFSAIQGPDEQASDRQFLQAIIANQKVMSEDAACQTVRVEKLLASQAAALREHTLRLDRQDEKLSLHEARFASMEATQRRLEKELREQRSSAPSASASTIGGGRTLRLTGFTKVVTRVKLFEGLNALAKLANVLPEEIVTQFGPSGTGGDLEFTTTRARQAFHRLEQTDVAVSIRAGQADHRVRLINVPKRDDKDGAKGKGKGSELAYKKQVDAARQRLRDAQLKLLDQTNLVARTGRCTITLDGAIVRLGTFDQAGFTTDENLDLTANKDLPQVIALLRGSPDPAQSA